MKPGECFCLPTANGQTEVMCMQIDGDRAIAQEVVYELVENNGKTIVIPVPKGQKYRIKIDSKIEL